MKICFCSTKGKPETPHDIRASEITSSSFKVQFSPSFDGGGGPQHFVIQVTLHDKNTTFNSTIIQQQLPFDRYEYTVESEYSISQKIDLIDYFRFK